MTYGYLIYQAERPLSPAEQRAVDARRGQLARGISRLLHRRPAPCTTVTCPDYPPAEWAAPQSYA